MRTQQPHLSKIANGRPIALVGMMGVGKTSIGKRLSQRLGMPFVDADAEIVSAAGLSITEIFERYGETQFRDGERRVLARLFDGKQKIVATGGGAFIDANTRAMMLERSLVIWIDAELEVLVERTSRRDDRPLLRNGNPAETLKRLIEERTPIYAEAHVHVRSDDVPHDKMIDRVIEAIQCA